VIGVVGRDRHGHRRRQARRLARERIPTAGGTERRRDRHYDHLPLHGYIVRKNTASRKKKARPRSAENPGRL